MIFTITVTDTESGVKLSITAKHNGVQDHMTDSLSCMVTAGLAEDIKQRAKAHSLRVTHNEAHPAD